MGRLTFVPFEEMNSTHTRALAESLAACPAFHRLDGLKLMDALKAGTSKLFEFEGGMLVVSVEQHDETGERRLMLEAWKSEGNMFPLREVFSDLRRLAAEWQCDVIETLVFDTRLLSAITRVGGVVESFCVVLDAQPKRVN